MAKTATGAFQHPDWRHQRPSKIEAGGTHESPDATKSVQEACKRCFPRHVMTNAGPVLYYVVLCYAAIHALHRIRGDTRKAWPKTMAKTATGALQHPARRHQRPSKIEAGGTHESPDATKSVQEAWERCPRHVQERPKAAQKRLQRGQDAPKTGPGGTQTPLKASPGSPKTHIGHDRHRQPLSKGCQNDFARFVALRAWHAKCVPTH